MCQSTSVITARREPDQPRSRLGKSFLGECVEGNAALRLETPPVKSRSSAEGIRYGRGVAADVRAHARRSQNGPLGEHGPLAEHGSPGAWLAVRSDAERTAANSRFIMERSSMIGAGGRTWV